MMPGSWRRRLAGSVVAVGMIGGATLYLPPGASSTDEGSGEAVIEQTTSTSQVLRETLQSSVEFNGDLGFGETRELMSGADGIVTWVPPEETVIRHGEIIWQIDAVPVPYLDGAIPMYRELFWGAKKGDDILQLEALLIDDGYGPDGWVADSTFDRTTHNALKKWQKAIGMTDDGAIAPTEVVFGTQPLRVVDAAYVGDTTGSGPILTVSGARAEVSVVASSRQLETFQRTPDVVIVLADGRELDATIDEVRATPADEEGRFGYQVTYLVEDSIGEAQPVKVRIEQTLAEDSLTVPVDALVALAEGGYALEVVTDGGNVLRGVEVIDFDDTRVAFTGDVAEGDLVVVP